MTGFTVSRSASIAADRARVHAFVNDFRAWPMWSPWEDLDPDMERSYSGAEAGVGAGYAWRGNRKAGAGSMQITGSTPERIDIDLQFEKPFKARNTLAFVLTPDDRGTEVTWVMSGQSSGLAGLFTRVVGMDRLVGRDFEKGLDRLRTAVESQPESPV